MPAVAVAHDYGDKGGPAHRNASPNVGVTSRTRLPKTLKLQQRPMHGMNVISRKTIDQFSKKHADAKGSLLTWYRETIHASWTGPADIKERYPSASFLSNNIVIFNIKGNRYRLAARCAGLRGAHVHLLLRRVVGGFPADGVVTFCGGGDLQGRSLQDNHANLEVRRAGHPRTVHVCARQVGNLAVADGFDSRARAGRLAADRLDFVYGDRGRDLPGGWVAGLVR